MTQATNISVETEAGAPLDIGTKLSGDQFTITGHLGAGGFGITYKALDNILGREIVIKECFSQDFCYRVGQDVVARSAKFEKQFRSIVDMFMREARSLARLRHPNIVGVHRAFEENATAYMVLDLIDGADLFEVLGRSATALPADALTEILLKLLDAIEKVHDMDLLHRDISPDNIILENTGSPVLIDFGAARADASRRTRAISSLLVVKDGYSPNEFYIPGSEQAPCSDLYALAATFYHAISGEPPVNSQTRMIEIAGNRPDPCVPLAGRFDDFDLTFLRAIDQAMQVHPRDRLQSAAEWRAMIEPAYAGFDAPTSAGIVASDVVAGISLSELVESTNDEVRKTRIIEAKKESEPKPVAEPKSSVPEWVEEFNQEALEREKSQGQDLDHLPEPVAVVKPLPTRIISAAGVPFEDLDRPQSTPQSQAQTRVLRPTSEGLPEPQPVQQSDPLPEPVADEQPNNDWVSRAKVKQQTRMIGSADPNLIQAMQQMEAGQAYPDSAQLRPISQKAGAKELIGPLFKALMAGVIIGLILIIVAVLVLPDLL